jgi:DNA primase
METEGLSFPEAVERLAGMAGLPMPRPIRESEEQDKKRATLHEVIGARPRISRRPARSGGQGARLSRRPPIDPATPARVRHSAMRAPDRFALRDALAAKGVSAEEMIAGGLLASRRGHRGSL